MFTTVRERLRQGLSEGRTGRQMVKDGTFADIDKDWGGGVLNTARFISIVETGMSGG